MKLATYQDGSRDGQLVVVSRDLTQAHYATHIANRMQQVLDDWNYLAPQLQDVYDALNAGRARHPFAFEPVRCMAPLPRAYQCLQTAAFAPRSDGPPVLERSGSDRLLGPTEPLNSTTSTGWALDFEAGVAVITADIPAGASVDRALDSVRLLALTNAVCWRDTGENEFSGVPACAPQRPSVAFAPVVITTDELGDAWSKGRMQLTLQVTLNGRKVGVLDTGTDMSQHFGHLLARASVAGPVQAGTILCAGPVSNAGVVRKGRTDWPAGYASLLQKRAMDRAQDGADAQVITNYLKAGDVLRLELKGRDGKSVMGAIEQEVVA